jgi:hypothetical protein
LLVDSLGTDFDTVLTRSAVVALALAATWALALVLAVAVEARSGGRVRLAERAGRCSRPRRLRRQATRGRTRARARMPGRAP